MLAAVTAPQDLDRLAARAFPAAEEEQAGGWLLRASPGEEPKRVNSGLPASYGLDVDVLERWYAARGLPPRIMVTPEDDLRRLDDELAERGWHVETPADVLVGDPGEVLTRLTGPPHQVVPAELTGPPATLRSPDPVVQLGAAEGAGRGTVVLQDGWTLMLALEVAPERRREGIAAALVRAWARVGEGRRLYLQVRRDNAAAHRLYEAAGFTRSHGYHYRTAPARAPGGTR